MASATLSRRPVSGRGGEVVASRLRAVRGAGILAAGETSGRSLGGKGRRAEAGAAGETSGTH